MVTPASAKQLYQQKIAFLAQQIKQKTTGSDNITLKKSTSNLFRHREKQSNKIDVRAFNQVIHIDQTNLLAEVEGMTTYETLVAATLKYGLLPTVVPELKSITIGGALSGIGVESSAFRYGLVHETIKQFDVLLPDGSIIDCRPDNAHRDLFFSFPNSYGTLGYALKVTVRLVPAKPYVKLTYEHFSDPELFFKRLEQVCLTNRLAGKVDFVDGVVFSVNHHVLITGEMIDRVPFVSNYRYLKIYYQSIKNKQHDYLTVADYIWRWDTDWFWCSKVFYLQNPLIRFLIGKWALKSTFYSKLMRLAKRNRFIRWLSESNKIKKESVIQDVAIPIKQAAAYLTFFHKHIGIKPIWLCPIHPRHTDRQYDLFKMNPNELYVNFGFWDMVPSTKPVGYYNRLVEQQVGLLGGNKSLYSNVYYTAEEFWQIYDKLSYQALKDKYDPSNRLNTLYQKCIEKN